MTGPVSDAAAAGCKRPAAISIAPAAARAATFVTAGRHQAKVDSRSGSGPNLNRRPVIPEAITRT